MANITKEPLGFEDFSFHDPGGAATAQTFPRTSSTGGPAVSIRKISAQDIPLRDASRFGVGRTPFEQLADNAAAKNVELALAEVSRTKEDLLNFESNGGIPGTGISAGDAAINDTVFTSLVTELLNGRYRGIFFPNIFEFPVATFIINRPNVTLTGVPGGGMKAHANFPAAGTLLQAVDCSSLRIHQMRFDHLPSAVGGSQCLSIDPLTGNINDIVLSRVSTSEAFTGVNINTAGTNRDVSNVWILDSTLNCDANPLSVLDFSRVNVGGCVFQSISGGNVLFTSSGGAHPLSGLRLYDNFVGAGGASSLQVLINRTGTFTPSIHKDIIVSRTQISNGHLQLNGVNEFTTNENTLFNGSIHANLPAGNAANIAFIRDRINAGQIAASSCIFINGAGTTLSGFEVSGGFFFNADHHGVNIDMNNGVARYGRIHHNHVIDCSRENAGTDYSGIILKDGAAKGVQYTLIDWNQIISQSAPKHKWGVEEQGALTCNRNHIQWNQVRGWVTAAVVKNGANSTAVNNFDEGTAVAP